MGETDQMGTRTAACVEDPFSGAWIECGKRVTPIQRDEGVRRRVIGFGPAVVSLSHPRSLYALSHSLKPASGLGAQLRHSALKGGVETQAPTDGVYHGPIEPSGAVYAEALCMAAPAFHCLKVDPQ